MRGFTVTYAPKVEALLADLWINAPDRKQVSEAANRADRVLRNDPFENSLPVRADLGAHLWMFDAAPLRFFYIVRMDDRLIEVISLSRLTS